MDIGSLFLIVALLVLVALFVSRPFFEPKTKADIDYTSLEEHDLSTLMAERDRVLNALQELDFDYTLGKIPEEDYPTQRAALVQRGADILRRLDILEDRQGQVSQGDLFGEEARLEAAVAARRADAGRVSSAEAAVRAQQSAATLTPANPEEELEILLANRRRARQETAAGFCPKCGGPVQKSDVFCPKCGTRLN